MPKGSEIVVSLIIVNYISIGTKGQSQSLLQRTLWSSGSLYIHYRRIHARTNLETRETLFKQLWHNGRFKHQERRSHPNLHFLGLCCHSMELSCSAGDILRTLIRCNNHFKHHAYIHSFQDKATQYNIKQADTGHEYLRSLRRRSSISNCFCNQYHKWFS